MKLQFSLDTNAKSSKNAQVLLNIVCRYLSVEPRNIRFEGDRYCGHRIEFELAYLDLTRSQAWYRLCTDCAGLANSWTFTAIHSPAAGHSNRSRIGGIQRLQWHEV